MKITKLSAHFSDTRREEVVRALVATFTPFGSLTLGVDGSALAEAMLRWVEAKPPDQPQLASDLVRILWEADTDDVSTVEVGVWEVVFRTPTSGTMIRLHRYAGGYHVKVDFGPNGSERRVAEILAAARQAEVCFDE